jgi:hypothetical protein
MSDQTMRAAVQRRNCKFEEYWLFQRMISVPHSFQQLEKRKLKQAEKMTGLEALQESHDMMASSHGHVPFIIDK